MAIIQTATSNFKAELLLGVHDFRVSGDTFKLALYTAAATLDANTASYTAAGEVVGTGYIAGGGALVNNGVTTVASSPTSGTGFTDFADLTFTNATITARGALIYNYTPSGFDNAGVPLVNPTVCVLDFGADKTSTTGDFTIIFPTPAAASAILRIS